MGRALGLALALAGALWAQGAWADCNKPAADAVMQVPLSGHPFSAIPTPDGCTLFVSLTAQHSRIAVLTRNDGQVQLAHEVAVPGLVTGMALSPDGRTLAAANGAGVLLFDAARLAAGDEKALVASADDGPQAASIYAAFSPDGHFLFVANERSASLTLYDLGGGALKAIGPVPTGGAPVGLVFSADGKRLYSTSEVGPRGWDAKCTSEGPPHPEGLLLMFDVAKAAADPRSAMVGGVPAGCNAVRVALSPDGATAYVTARGANALLAFDAARLALKATVAVGKSPVGVAAAGDKVFVTNSDRFGGGGNQSVSVLGAANLSGPQGSIPAGGFPRELKVTADGKTLLVTNYASGSLELADLARLPE